MPGCSNTESGGIRIHYIQECLEMLGDKENSAKIESALTATVELLKFVEYCYSSEYRFHCVLN